jgi:chlorobactene glucosyltransferase
MTALAGPAFVLEAVALTALLAAFFWIVRNLRALPQPPLAERVDRGTLPSLCVVLPVRDEERDVEECVASILAQDYPGLEVVVVDDGSTDQTPAILARLAASDPRLRVKRNDTLPPGWMGKNHALDVGAAESASEWVLFMDVDVRLEPDSLVRALALAVEREADLFTIVPEIVTVSFWERVVMPFIINVILMVFPARELNDPSHPAASGNGPFMLFRRAAYQAIGGHAAIKGEVIEDLVLAQAIKKGGKNLVYAQGVELARLRMYRSLEELWRGWSKNFHVSVRGNVLLAVLGAVALLAIFAAPWILPIVGVLGWQWPIAESHWFGVSALGGAYVLAALTIRRLLRDVFKLDDSLAWLTPVAACITAAILVNSTLRAASGKGVSWKGRTYGTAGEGELRTVAATRSNRSPIEIEGPMSLKEQPGQCNSERKERDKN